MDRDTKSHKMGPNWNENSIIRICRIESVDLSREIVFLKWFTRRAEVCLGIDIKVSVYAVYVVSECATQDEPKRD